MILTKCKAIHAETVEKRELDNNGTRDDHKGQSEVECGRERSTNIFCNIEKRNNIEKMIAKLIDHSQEFTNIEL